MNELIPDDLKYEVTLYRKATGSRLTVVVGPLVKCGQVLRIPDVQAYPGWTISKFSLAT